MDAGGVAELRELLEASRDRCTIEPMDLVVVEGEGARGFLETQLSQSMETVEAGPGAWSLVLEPDGMLGFVVRVVALAGDRFCVVGSTDQAEALAARLNRFRFRVAAEVRVETWGLCSGLSSPEPDVHLAPLVTAVPWCDQWLSVSPSSSGSSAIATEGFADAASLLAGALCSADGRSGANPFELGRSFLDRAVSFTKGCYTGQELVARVDARGAAAPRRLCRFEGAAEALIGPLEAEGAQVGELLRTVVDTSQGSSVGVALVARRVVLDAPLRVRAGKVEGFLSEL